MFHIIIQRYYSMTMSQVLHCRAVALWCRFSAFQSVTVYQVIINWLLNCKFCSLTVAKDNSQSLLLLRWSWNTNSHLWHACNFHMCTHSSEDILWFYRSTLVLMFFSPVIPNLQGSLKWMSCEFFSRPFLYQVGLLWLQLWLLRN